MYRAIDCKTWDDPWFSELDTEHKLLFLYLITNRRSTPCGAFEITLRAMTNETGIDRARLETLLTDLSPRVAWFPHHQTLFLRNFYKHQKCNPNFQKGAARAAADFPDDVQSCIYAVYPELAPKGKAPQPSRNGHTAENNGSPTVPEQFVSEDETVPDSSEEVQYRTVQDRTEQSQARPGQTRARGETPAGNTAPGMAGWAEGISSGEDAPSAGEPPNAPEEAPSVPECALSEPDPEGTTWQDKATMLCRYGVSGHKAERLARGHTQACLSHYAECLRYRASATPAILVKSIQEHWETPTDYLTAQTSQAEREKRAAEAQQEAARERQRQEYAQAVHGLIDEAWQRLDGDEQSDIEQHIRSELLKEPLVKHMADKYPDTWLSRPGLPARFLSLRNALLVERGHIPEGDAS